MNRETVATAESAAELLENPLLQAVFSDIDREIVIRWRESKTPEEREKFYHQQHALKEVRGKLLDKIYQAAGEERRSEGKPSFWREKLNQLKNTE